MAFDYKKEYKEFYLPPKTPTIVTVPPMHFVAVRGMGDPNEAGGAYQKAMQKLYGIAFTIKMSGKKDAPIEGFFDYVVPPLEGLWFRRDEKGEILHGIDHAHKEQFCWVSMIRLPDFVTQEDFARAKTQVQEKKKIELSDVEYFRYGEGLCVQCMHIGPFDDEARTVAQMTQFMQQEGCAYDFSDARLHHEIYLSDARRAAPEKLRTVIRLPIRRG